MKFSLLFLFSFTFVFGLQSNVIIDNGFFASSKINISQDSITTDSLRVIKVSDFFNLIKKSNKQSRIKKGLSNFDYNYESFPDYYNFTDTVISSPVFLPSVFTGELLDPNLDFRDDEKLRYNTKTIDSKFIDQDSIIGFKPLDNTYKDSQYTLLSEEESLKPEIEKLKESKEIRKMYYVSNPDKVSINSSDLNYNLPSNLSSVIKENSFKELLKTDQVEIKAPTVNPQELKQKFWKVSFQNNLDIAQTNYTDNWDSQGNSTTQLNSLQRVDAVYRKNKLEFTHWTEWKLSIQRWALSDEDKAKNKSELLLNEDYLRTYNKLALDAFLKKWSYIWTIETKTPLFVKKDKDNRDKKLASFLSPLTMNIGIGAGYNYNWASKKNKFRKITITIDAQPFSLDLKYIADDEVWANNNNGVVYTDERAGQRRFSKFEFGSNINLTIDYKINSYISLYSRNRFFTNYHKLLIESENTFNFILNKYLSTKLYFYGRFNDDDPTKKDKRLNYFSYKDAIRFGFSFNW